MARTNRGKVFAADEIAVVHVMNRVVRRCFLMGDDPVSGKNTEVARRWLMLCPKRKDALGRAKEPAVLELNSIRLDADKTAEIRGRLRIVR